MLFNLIISLKDLNYLKVFLFRLSGSFFFFLIIERIPLELECSSYILPKILLAPIFEESFNNCSLASEANYERNYVFGRRVLRIDYFCILPYNRIKRTMCSDANAIGPLTWGAKMDN